MSITNASSSSLLALRSGEPGTRSHTGRPTKASVVNVVPKSHHDQQESIGLIPAIVSPVSSSSSSSSSSSLSSGIGASGISLVERIRCSSCRLIAIDPRVIPGCTHLICHDCLHIAALLPPKSTGRLTSSSSSLLSTLALVASNQEDIKVQTCPQPDCDQEFTRAMLTTIDESSSDWESVLSLHITCPQRSCTWIGSYRDLSQHTRSCRRNTQPTVCGACLQMIPSGMSLWSLVLGMWVSDICV